ncbi:MAG: hypothetical protein LBH07_03385, partial [Treponema sp.]|nr:hypothetical protein [Treponema sp.]
MMRLRSALFFISVIFVFFVLFGISSCTGPERLKETYSTESEKVLPPKKELPVIQILDYKNRNEGAAPSLWLRSYLENGITGPESFTVYRGNYLFIAYTRSNIRPVINQWMGNYSIDRDFSRLVADRIRRRLEQDISGKSPDMVYGPNYERAIKTTLENTFWG